MSTMTVEEVRGALSEGKRLLMTVGTDPQDPILEVWLLEGCVMYESVSGWSNGIIEPVCALDSTFMAEFVEDKRSIEVMA